MRERNRRRNLQCGSHGTETFLPCRVARPASLNGRVNSGLLCITSLDRGSREVAIFARHRWRSCQPPCHVIPCRVPIKRDFSTAVTEMCIKRQCIKRVVLVVCLLAYVCCTLYFIYVSVCVCVRVRACVYRLKIERRSRGRDSPF